MDSSRNFRFIRVIIFITNPRSTLLIDLEKDLKISLPQLKEKNNLGRDGRSICIDII
jgi:hypothetical protein